jgi:signal peptidase I
MDTAKRIWNISVRILSILLVAFAVLMMVFTVLSVTTLDKNERSIFGYRFYVVASDSMSPSENNADERVHFCAGDIIVVKRVKDPRAIGEGEIISFISTNRDSYGETVTHKIRRVERGDGGTVRGYVTYGTHTGTDDESIVEPEFVLGVYRAKLPAVGRFFAFVKTTPGYIVCILVPFLLLILYNGTNVVRLFCQYKAEQVTAMQAERDEIAAEREENRRMMAELLALKAQLEKEGKHQADGAESTATHDSERAE